ncbi:unnamed protein product, partial [Iphiclides podalirius]
MIDWSQQPTQRIVYLHMSHLIALGAESGKIGRLFAMMIHMYAEKVGASHTFLAYVSLESTLARVMLIPYVHLQIVAGGEEPMAGWTLYAARFAVPP